VNAERALSAAPRLASDGVPNYFDDQRFGSLGEAGEFIARPWCRGQWERAIWLIVADGNEHDSAEEREQKRLLRTHWGDWSAWLDAAPHARWRNVVAHLARRPGDFRGAIAAVRQDLRSLYLAAYQSDLWNGMLSALVEQQIPAEKRISPTIGRRQVAFWQELPAIMPAEWNTKTLPLPSARLHESDSAIRALIDQVLQPEGLELRQLRVKYPRDSFFSKGDRPVLVRPVDFSAHEAADELYPGRTQLTLQFSLPRGAYATVMVKRLFAE
jgi:tRNA pseudouridine13 synthase